MQSDIKDDRGWEKISSESTYVHTKIYKADMKVKYRCRLSVVKVCEYGRIIGSLVFIDLGQHDIKQR